MYGYAGASAAASKLTPFTSPPATTNPAGLARQSAAVTHATTTAAGGHTEQIISTAPRLMSAAPQALQALASPSSSAAPTSPLSFLLEARPYLDSLSGHARTTASTMSFLVGAAALGRSMHAEAIAGEAEDKATGAASGGLQSAGSSGRGAGGGGAALAANIGRAASVGGLSVPQSWAAAAPTMGSAAPAPTISSNAAPASGVAGVPLMPVGGVPGRGVGHLTDASRFLPRPKMAPRWPAGG